MGKWSGEYPASFSWHPLIDHCADVAACFESLLKIPLIRKRLARSCGKGDLTPRQIARLSELAAWHDLGKINRGFQEHHKGEMAQRRGGHVGEAGYLIEKCFLRKDMGSTSIIPMVWIEYE
ncbi:MAG: CRISPR-associated endonuclease Cas3'' [Magnetococcales bacterium]|nr:CRISPR-associated endonuclease Cas3'' [Magnetococcales bacterium]